MKWDEFCSLLSGLSPESPLGRIVQIVATMRNTTRGATQVNKSFFPSPAKSKSKQKKQLDLEVIVMMINVYFSLLLFQCPKIFILGHWLYFQNPLSLFVNLKKKLIAICTKCLLIGMCYPLRSGGQISLFCTMII